MAIKHPTSSEGVAGRLAKLDAPTPWTASTDDPGSIRDADLTYFAWVDKSDDPKKDLELATLIVTAVNTLAGWKATATPTLEHPTGPVFHPRDHPSRPQD